MLATSSAQASLVGAAYHNNLYLIIAQKVALRPRLAAPSSHRKAIAHAQLDPQQLGMQKEQLLASTEEPAPVTIKAQRKRHYLIPFRTPIQQRTVYAKGSWYRGVQNVVDLLRLKLQFGFRSF